MNISAHISYREATHSQPASRRSIDNNPDEATLERMRYVAENAFEPVRVHFGVPIYVSSFFRSKTLNTAIGGSSTS